MSEPNVHPDILSRYNQLIKDLDTLTEAVVQTEIDLMALVEQGIPIAQQMKDFESHMIHLLEVEKVPASMLQKQEQVSKDAREYGFKLLTTLPRLCHDDAFSAERIFKFQLRIFDRLSDLATLQHDKKRSEAQITKLEKELRSQQEVYEKARKRFNDCQHNLKQLQTIFNSLLN